MVNKLIDLIYRRRTFYLAFDQWFALMFPHIPDNDGVRFDDVDAEDLAYWFWKHLNDDWDT